MEKVSNVSLEDVADALRSRDLMVIVCGYVVDVDDESVEDLDRLWMTCSLGLELKNAWPSIPLHQILQEVPSTEDTRLMRVLQREKDLHRMCVVQKREAIKTALRYHSSPFSLSVIQMLKLTAFNCVW